MDKKLRKKIENLVYLATQIAYEAPCDDEYEDLYAEIANVVNEAANRGIEGKMQDEIETELSNGTALVAYAHDGDYPGCGVVYRTKEGYEYDIALVEAEGPEDEYDQDKIRIYAYGDPYQDDYTDRFDVSRGVFDKMSEDAESEDK